MHCMFDRQVLCCGCGELSDGVYQLRCRVILVDSRGEHVCAVSEQHVFRGVGVVVPAVPGERAVGRRERGPGVLLLQSRIRACGGRADVPDLRAGDVEQPARADGVLELLGGLILYELQRGRERNMPELSAGTVVTGGKSELQRMPRELSCSELERVSDQLHV